MYYLHKYFIIPPSLVQNWIADYEGKPHKDYESYFSLANNIFGVKFRNDFQYFLKELITQKGFHQQTWKFKEIFEYYDGVKRNGTALNPVKCYTIIESYVGSCGGKDCTATTTDYHFIDQVKWALRNVGSKRNCEERGLGESITFSCVHTMAIKFAWRYFMLPHSKVSRPLIRRST